MGVILARADEVWLAAQPESPVATSQARQSITGSG